MKAFNVLVTGHRPNRLPEDGERLGEIKAGLLKTIRNLATFATASERKLRLIAGDASGTDQWAQAIANDLRLEFVVAGLAKQSANDLSAVQPLQTEFWLSNAPQDGGADLRHHAVVDEAKLFYADLVIVVWDGAPPAGVSAGSVRLLIEAVHQRKPVLWVDAGSHSTGSLRWLGISYLDAPSIALLDADESNVQHLKGLFRDLPKELDALPAYVRAELETYLLPNSAEGFKKLLEHWDPGEFPIKAGWIHSGFLRLFGYPRLEGGKYESYPVGGFEFPKDAKESFWDNYHALDRAAVKASHVHRDQVVLTHLLAALAVLCAVAGSIGLDTVWGFAEFIALVLILSVVRRDRKQEVSAHKAHLSLRHGAETFRVLALLRPFLACLPRIERNQWTSAPNSLNGFDLSTPQTWWVLRWFRDNGSPKSTGLSQYTLTDEITELKEALTAFIEDQRNYHRGAHHRWHKIHLRIELTMKIIFSLALGAVLAHLFALGSHYAEHHDWSLPKILFILGHVIHEYSPFLLIITAFGPALAASLHGISGKLEIARLAVHSDAIYQQLSDLRSAVQKIKTTADTADANCMTLRGLAVQTANTLYAEHEAWISLLHGQDLDIPA